MDAIIFCQRWRAFFHCFALPESKQASRKFSIPSPPAPFFLVILSIILLRDLREFTVQLTVDSYLFNKIFAQLQLSQWEINVNWTLSRCWVPGCSKVLGAVPEETPRAFICTLEDGDSATKWPTVLQSWEKDSKHHSSSPVWIAGSSFTSQYIYCRKQFCWLHKARRQDH
jgi:hypothetical protein